MSERRFDKIVEGFLKPRGFNVVVNATDEELEFLKDLLDSDYLGVKPLE